MVKSWQLTYKQEVNFLFSLVEKLINDRVFSFDQHNSRFVFFLIGYNKNPKIIERLNKKLRRNGWQIELIWNEIGMDEYLTEIRVIEYKPWWAFWR